MITIGVTGGIGSGKSVVCDIFRLQGIPVYDADSEAKELNDTSPVIRAQIIRHFGEELYRDGRLDRKAFASLISGMNISWRWPMPSFIPNWQTISWNARETTTPSDGGHRCRPAY